MTVRPGPQSTDTDVPAEPARAAVPPETSPERPWVRLVRIHGAWVLGLCTPLAVLSLYFKIGRINQTEGTLGVFGFVGLMLSDLCVLFAWVAASLGLQLWTERRWARVATRVSLQLLAVVYVLLQIAAHGYFMSTGSSLDFPMLSFSLTHLQETAKVIGSARSWDRTIAGAVTVLAALVLPWIAARLSSARHDAHGLPRGKALLASLATSVCLLTLAANVRSKHGVDLARDPVVNLALTVPASIEQDNSDVLEKAKQRPVGAQTVVASTTTPRKNLVLILLESTANWATSITGGRYETTPFLKELGSKSVVFTRMHAVEPHTSKALSTTICGIEPRPGFGITESLPGGMLGKCLPTLLNEQGYRTAYFQAATQRFESRSQLVTNAGFEEFTSGDKLKHEGLKKSNYFGYEDRILLPALGSFLESAAQNRDKPFLLAILTNQAHHDYQLVSKQKEIAFDSAKVKNRYLNAVNYDDQMLRDLLAKFDALELTSNTVFMILGDHGEGFGEHGRQSHDDTIYEEGMHIPFLIYDPSGSHPPERRESLHNQLDVVPTALELLGMKVTSGSYVGSSVFADGPEKPRYGACYNENKCLARYEGSLKYIHHFDRRTDELFDLSKDPLERENLLESMADDAERMKADLLDWYRVARAMYRDTTSKAVSKYVSDKPPTMKRPLKTPFRFGSSVEYIGYSVDVDAIKPGQTLTLTYHFRILETLPEGYRLFIHGHDGKKRHEWRHVPVQRLHPEEEWAAGEYVSDPHRIRIPKDWKSSKIVVRGGFRTAKNDRLRVTPEAQGEAPVLAEIKVRR